MAYLILLFGGLLISQDAVPAPRNSADDAAALRAQADRVRREESDQLSDLAGRLEKARKPTDAERVRALIEPAPPPNGPERIRALPEVVNRVAGLADGRAAPEDAARIRAATARAYFEIAGQAAAPNVERFALADACLREVVAREPDHREARRLLGYVEHDRGWAKPQAARDLKAGKVLDTKFGWVPADWVPHLTKGELPGRLDKGRAASWLPAKQADKLREASDLSRAWEIETEHFSIRTNVPLSEAIAFGRRLEAIHDGFFALFADVIGAERLPLAERFRNRELWAEPARSKHQVWYFASKQQYRSFFKTRFKQNERFSLGYYMPPDEAESWRVKPRSYFYRDTENPIGLDETLFHEASHQLLFENAGPTAFARNHGNYWVWEGLGTYFETFRILDDGHYEVGGLIGPRIAKARDDLIVNDRAVPSSRFVALDKATFQQRQEIYLHYAQAMALAIFLMQFDHGRYRVGFTDYVVDAYRGRLSDGGPGPPLFDRLGVRPAELDGQFLKFLDEGTKPAAGG